MPSDLVRIKGRGDNTLYLSPYIESVWKKGNISVGHLTFESAAYVARYVTKKVTGERAESHYSRYDEASDSTVSITPEFAAMSRRPGIASAWYERHGGEVYPRDEIIVRSKSVKPPRFYDTRLAEFDLQLHQEIKERRKVLMDKHRDNNTWERLKVRDDRDWETNSASLVS